MWLKEEGKTGSTRLRCNILIVHISKLSSHICLDHPLTLFENASISRNFAHLAEPDLNISVTSGSSAVSLFILCFEAGWVERNVEIPSAWPMPLFSRYSHSPEIWKQFIRSKVGATPENERKGWNLTGSAIRVSKRSKSSKNRRAESRHCVKKMILIVGQVLRCILKALLWWTSSCLRWVITSWCSNF